MEEAYAKGWAVVSFDPNKNNGGDLNGTPCCVRTQATRPFVMSRPFSLRGCWLLVIIDTGDPDLMLVTHQQCNMWRSYYIGLVVSSPKQSSVACDIGIDGGLFLTVCV